MHNKMLWAILLVAIFKTVTSLPTFINNKEYIIIEEYILNNSTNNTWKITKELFEDIRNKGLYYKNDATAYQLLSILIILIFVTAKFFYTVYYCNRCSRQINKCITFCYTSFHHLVLFIVFRFLHYGCRRNQ